MSGVATAIGGAALIGYIANENASSRAAGAQQSAVNSSNQLQWNMYNQNRQDNQPWRQAGQAALNQLSYGSIVPTMESDPGYQFRLGEGNKAINQAAASRGMGNSGATLKALARYGQDYASNEYNNIYNRNYSRLSALAGFGNTINSQNNSNATGIANSVGNNMMAGANSSAAANMASANNLSNLVNSGANGFMQYQMMNRIGSPASASSFSGGGNLGYTGYQSGSFGAGGIK